MPTDQQDPTDGWRPARDRLYALQAFPARLISMAPDGRDVRTVVSGLTGIPDGLTVDLGRRHVTWTNMGRRFGRAGGFIERANLDGTERTIVVPEGMIMTPKQISYDPTTDHLYWCDREGMRVMRSTWDGSDIAVLVQAGSGKADECDRQRHCVGIAIDARNGLIYWSQKGPSNGNAGRILRAALDLPPGTEAAARGDVETLMDGLPEPIDLLLDPETSTLFWTDRGRPPRGNTLNAAMVGPDGCSGQRILMEGLAEGIGVCKDPASDTLFVTDLVLGHVRKLDLRSGRQACILRRGWPLTGIAYVPAE